MSFFISKPKLTIIFLFCCIFSFNILGSNTAIHLEDNPLVILVPSREAVISSRIDTTVSKLYIKEGASIKKGATAVLLDSTPFVLEKNTLLRELEKLTTREKYLETVFERYEKLYKKSAVAKSVYDNAKFQSDQINNEQRTLESQLRILELDIGYARILAPFDGHITKIIVHEHEYVKRGDPVFKIITDQKIHVIINFHESLIHQLEIGQSVEFKLRYSNKIHTAKIIQILPEIDPETKTVKVIAEIDNKDSKLKIGMIGTCLGILKSTKEEKNEIKK
ncbi:MAG: efflux RND transporter periplasmic adaptor subunit [bacterium]|nr:efflux RND transporter periplasmic adaptor subunit [bacterium]